MASSLRRRPVGFESALKRLRMVYPLMIGCVITYHQGDRYALFTILIFVLLRLQLHNL